MKNRNIKSALANPHRWKIYVAAGSIFIAGGLAVFSEQAQAFGITALEIQLFAAVLAVGPLAIAVITIRCPNCGLRLMPFAMSHKGVGKWLDWLMTVDTCPRCGHSDEVTTKP